MRQILPTAWLHPPCVRTNFLSVFSRMTILKQRVVPRWEQSILKRKTQYSPGGCWLGISGKCLEMTIDEIEYQPLYIDIDCITSVRRPKNSITCKGRGHEKVLLFFWILSKLQNPRNPVTTWNQETLAYLKTLPPKCVEVQGRITDQIWFKDDSDKVKRHSIDNRNDKKGELERQRGREFERS